jgi:aminoglycoside phosphotransferase (APT) family kinase protein
VSATSPDVRGCAVGTFRLQDALLGGLGAAGVREVVLDPCRFGVAELLKSQVPRGGNGRLELVRTKFKPARKLTAYYRLLQDHGQPLPLAVTWSIAGSTGAVGVDLLRYPADPTMPHLSRLTPAHLSESVAALTGEPVVPAADAVSEVVRYRPGQRHVLRVRSRSRRDDRGVFVKIDRDDSGVVAVPVARTLAAVLAAAGAGAPVEPLGYCDPDHAAFWRAATGEPLTGLLGSEDVGTRRVVALVGRTLRAVHDYLPAPDVEPGWWAGLRTADGASEVAGTLRAGEHILALAPDAGSRYERGVRQVEEALACSDGLTVALAHGDYKSDNLLVHRGRVRVLDLDRVRLAEPAMDLGKFLSDLRWWCGADDDRVQALQAAFLVGYGPCDPSTSRRARLFEALYRLKAVARRIPVHAPTWATDAERETASAVGPLIADWRPR